MQNAITELETLTLTNAAKGYLNETAKWCKFLAILGFIGVGFLLLGSFFIGTAYNSMPVAATMPFDLGVVITIVYIISLLIYIFPLYYLYQFSTQMKMAILKKEDAVLAKSFEMLKSHFKFIGVFTIILLSFYLLALILSLFGAVAT